MVEIVIGNLLAKFSTIIVLFSRTCEKIYIFANVDMCDMV